MFCLYARTFTGVLCIFPVIDSAFTLHLHRLPGNGLWLSKKEEPSQDSMGVPFNYSRTTKGTKYMLSQEMDKTEIIYFY